MLNFFKKQITKIGFFLIILIAIIIFSGFKNQIIINILIMCAIICLLIIQKTWHDDYILENNKELEEYKKNQNEELEKYKSKLSDRTLVTKLQYELEFEIYKELYCNLMEIYFVDKNDKEKLNELISNLKKRILQNMPFYSKEIVAKFSTVAIFFDINDKMEENNILIQMFIIQNNIEISNLIRHRIESMKIVED